MAAISSPGAQEKKKQTFRPRNGWGKGKEQISSGRDNFFRMKLPAFSISFPPIEKVCEERGNHVKGKKTDFYYQGGKENVYATYVVEQVSRRARRDEGKKPKGRRKKKGAGEQSVLPSHSERGGRKKSQSASTGEKRGPALLDGRKGKKRGGGAIKRVRHFPN